MSLHDWASLQITLPILVDSFFFFPSQCSSSAATQSSASRQYPPPSHHHHHHQPFMKSAKISEVAPKFPCCVILTTADQRKALCSTRLAGLAFQQPRTCCKRTGGAAGSTSTHKTPNYTFGGHAHHRSEGAHALKTNCNYRNFHSSCERSQRAPASGSERRSTPLKRCNL